MNKERLDADPSVDEDAELPKQKSSRSCLVSILIAAAVCACIGLFLINCVYRYTAISKSRTMDSDAKRVFNAAASYMTDQYAAGNDVKIATKIYNKSDDRANDPVYQGIYPYCTDIDDMNFALICEDGAVTGTLFSFGKIEDEDLTQLQSYEEQRKLLSSVFTYKKAVSNYGFPHQADAILNQIKKLSSTHQQE